MEGRDTERTQGVLAWRGLPRNWPEDNGLRDEGEFKTKGLRVSGGIWGKTGLVGEKADAG